MHIAASLSQEVALYGSQNPPKCGLKCFELQITQIHAHIWVFPQIVPKTPQNDQFSRKTPMVMVVRYHLFRKPPYTCSRH